MKLSTFNIFLDWRINQTKSVLAYKSSEYAVGDDKLYNFKRAAIIENTTPIRALWGMAAKHLVSIIDIVESDKKQSPKRYKEKIGDMINYLILLEALLDEGESYESVDADSE